MATNTYVALATNTVATATPSVTFTGISTAYTDLIMVINGGLSTVNQSFRFQVGNGSLDTGNNYSYTYIAGNGSSASSSRASNTNGFNVYHVSGQSDTSIKSNTILQFQNYSNTTTNKTILCRGNTDLETAATVALWRGTNAINTIIVGTTSGNLVAGTTISLYGIAATSVGAKATGGAIYSDASYFYHVFSGNGTFTPTQSISADVLVVAGGGGTNGQSSGGGGAGGLLIQSGRSLTATNYTVTVGAGGAGGDAAQASSGSNSVFDTSTALGGGFAGYANITPNGSNGGSGGGGAYNGTVATTSTQGNSGGATGYGFGGGTGNQVSGQAAGGGGGAGAAGTNASSGAVAGNGGIGRTDSLINAIGAATGMGQLVSGNYYFAGGGGGATVGGTIGAGGSGGGGAGGNYNTGSPNGTAGLANTGGGAGGRGTGGLGFAGGSGVVIVRYAK